MIRNVPRMKLLLLTGLLTLAGCNTALQNSPGTPLQQATAYGTWQAESYSSQTGTQLETTTDVGGGQNVGFIGNGDVLVYNNVDFGTSNTVIACVATLRSIPYFADATSVRLSLRPHPAPLAVLLVVAVALVVATSSLVGRALHRAADPAQLREVQA